MWTRKPEAPARGAGARMEEHFGAVKGGDLRSEWGFEGAWKRNAGPWGHGVFKGAVQIRMELVKSPAGAYQWLRRNVDEEEWC